MDKRKFSAIVNKYLRGNATFEEKRFLEAYYEELHTGEQIENIFNDKQIDSFGVEMLNAIKKARLKAKAPVKPISYFRQYRVYAVAASLFILISIVLFIRYRHSSASDNQVVYSKSGNVIRLELSDGTIVWLNAKSKLSFPKSFNNKINREVNLVFGKMC